MSLQYSLITSQSLQHKSLITPTPMNHLYMRIICLLNHITHYLLLSHCLAVWNTSETEAMMLSSRMEGLWWLSVRAVGNEGKARYGQTNKHFLTNLAWYLNFKVFRSLYKNDVLSTREPFPCSQDPPIRSSYDHIPQMKLLRGQDKELCKCKMEQDSNSLSPTSR